MIVVSDSSPIITLAHINKLDLLKHLYTQIIVPEAVYKEIAVIGRGRPGAQELQDYNWITAQTVHSQRELDSLQGKLGAGEIEAIHLALELNADLLLLDDRLARREALTRGLKVSGLLGVLTLAKPRGIIQEIRPLLDDMMAVGCWLSRGIYEQTLRIAKEL